MPLYDYLTPKLDFKCKFNHRQSFLSKGRLTVRTIRKFRIGSSLRIESRIGSSIRNRIESRSFAGPYSKLKFLLRFDQNVEYMDVGVYPLRDFHKICRVCIPFQDALAVKISLDLLKGLQSYEGFKI